MRFLLVAALSTQLFAGDEFLKDSINLRLKIHGEY